MVKIESKLDLIHIFHLYNNFLINFFLKKGIIEINEIQTMKMKILMREILFHQ